MNAPVAEALRRLSQSGRKLVLVTGRRLEDLQLVCPALDIFDRVVAENGALLYEPASRETRLLAEPPPPAFVEGLARRGVRPVAVGSVIVATWTPHEQAVLETIQALGLELQVIFNKGAVMVLPSGINKATGLRAALDELGLSTHDAVAVGDAENDHALLMSCECGVAVANALPSLKERADLVTKGDHGAGVAELCARLMATDLGELGPALRRHDLLLGTDLADGSDVMIPAYGQSLLVAGTSGGGKSTAVMGLLERLKEQGYQHAIIDPEGDYGAYEHAVVLGDARRAPTVEEVLEVLAKPSSNVVVNLLGLSLDHRPPFFESLLPRLQEMRARCGRPHWLVVDEAHHVLPGGRQGAPLATPQELHGLVLVTVHPEHVAKPIVERVDLVMAIGQTPDETLREFAAAGGQPPPAEPIGPLATGDAVVWSRSSARSGASPRRIRTAPPRAERQRHVRKYADGDLGDEGSFYFRGPEGRLNLRAQNLQMFLQVAEGVDAETWLHHLRAGDYARWARAVIKDERLAAALLEIEDRADDDPEGLETRAAVRAAVEARYTAPP